MVQGWGLGVGSGLSCPTCQAARVRVQGLEGVYRSSGDPGAPGTLPLGGGGGVAGKITYNVPSRAFKSRTAHCCTWTLLVQSQE